MSKKTTYDVVRIPEDDWKNLMETVILDGAYSEEIKNEVWTAIENIEFFSNPWVIVKVENGKSSAKIFRNKEAAEKYVKKLNNKSSNSQIFCIKGQYQSER